MARRAARAFAAAVDRVTAALAFLGIGALTGAIAVVCGDIVWRRIGGGSFIGAVDLTQLCVVAAVSWSIPYAFARGTHVTVDLLGAVLPRGAERLLDTLAALVAMVLVGFLLLLSWRRATEQWAYGDVSQDLAIPFVLHWSFLLSGLAMAAVACLATLLLRLIDAPGSAR